MENPKTILPRLVQQQTQCNMANKADKYEVSFRGEFISIHEGYERVKYVFDTEKEAILFAVELEEEGEEEMQVRVVG